jgi:glycosyltransferase involved in cell wall biosynthesis
MKNSITVIIPTFNRGKSLDKALWSLSKNTELPEKVIIVDAGSKDETNEVVKKFQKLLNIEFLVTEKGLIKQMNFALERVSTEIFIRTDDDVIFSKNWIKAIRKEFNINKNVLGVTGPTIVPLKFKKNRDLIRIIFSKNIIFGILNYFCDQKICNIGYFSSCGFFSVGTNFFNSRKRPSQDVDYLEACNFALKTKLAIKLNGFSSDYGTIGEYNEPDLCFRVKNLMPEAIFRFSPQACLYHCPSLSGFFNSRTNYDDRMSNLYTFINKHIIYRKNYNKLKTIQYIFLINLFFFVKSTVNLNFKYKFLIRSIQQIYSLIRK